MGRGDGNSEEKSFTTEYIERTGCSHIDGVLKSMREANFNLDEFLNSNDPKDKGLQDAYWELYRTVRDGERYGFQAAPRYDEDERKESSRRSGRS
ncbi:MAG: hypothetical protein NZM26_05050 [Patescibacteria group bacterium]|nr:hypothetical protein [Patescibacteria group bacterium]